MSSNVITRFKRTSTWKLSAYAQLGRPFSKLNVLGTKLENQVDESISINVLSMYPRRCGCSVTRSESERCRVDLASIQCCT